MHTHWIFTAKRAKERQLRLSKLELPGTDMLTQAKTATNVSMLATFCMLGFFNCACTAPSPFRFHLTSRTCDEFYQVPSFFFLHVSLKNWEEPGYEASCLESL